ncbi:MAG: hypothetical protein KGH75_05820 [Rhodospirillales bacterium]|nr:hypothetical protein [Rhodospirillales bacterium]
MGRPSKLTDRQWSEIERRMVNGEAIRALAREYGIQPGSIRAKLSIRVENTKLAAESIVKTGELLDKLPVIAQQNAHGLADRLRSISSHLAGGADYGARTFHRLSMIANTKAEEIDESATLTDNAEAIRSVMAIQSAANEAAKTGINLLAANKDAIKNLNREPNDGPGLPALPDDQLAKVIKGLREQF